MVEEGGLLVDSFWISLGVLEQKEGISCKSTCIEDELCNLKNTRNVEGLRSQAIFVSFHALISPEWYVSVRTFPVAIELS